MAENLHRDAPILVVDDDDVNRELLRMQLQRAGFRRVTAVEEGHRALEIVADSPPSLILLDVMMPDIDGYEVTQQIRQMYPNRFIPIMLLSALQKPADRTRGIQAGANDFVSKPFNLNELVARVNSLLAVKEARDDLQKERERLALLYDVSRTLSAQLDYQQLVRQIVTLTQSLTGAAASALLVLDSDYQLTDAITSDDATAEQIAGWGWPSDGLIPWVARHHQSVLLPDVTEDERPVPPLLGERPIRGVVAAPLLRGDTAIGVLLMTAPDPAAFTEEHLNLLLAISSQAAMLLENARLFSQVRRERRRAEALIKQTGDPVLVTNSDRVIVDMNPASEELLGPTELVGQRLDDVFPPGVYDLVLRAEERQAAVSGEASLRTDDAPKRSYNISVSPIEDVGFMLVWQDITSLKEGERVRLESERAQTQRVLEAWTRYMSPALVERVLNDPDILRRQERREALVMFADLRGFTRLTVQHTPADVIMLLNDVFEKMTDVVYEQDGVIFDIIGDELMVGFNVPYSQPDARRRALATAVEMQRRFDYIRDHWGNVGMHVGLGIGINCGQVVLGHVGGRARMNYAMVGEAVNLAHRLVELAEDRQIIVTPDVLHDGPPPGVALDIQPLPAQQFAGIDRPQEILLIQPE